MVVKSIARFVQDKVQANFLPTQSCDGSKGWEGSVWLHRGCVYEGHCLENSRLNIGYSDTKLRFSQDSIVIGMSNSFHQCMSDTALLHNLFIFGATCLSVLLSQILKIKKTLLSKGGLDQTDMQKVVNIWRIQYFQLSCSSYFSTELINC